MHDDDVVYRSHLLTLNAAAVQRSFTAKAEL